MDISGVRDAVLGQPLVDHHCHGVVTRELDRSGLEALLSEGGAPPEGVTNFDTPLGLAVRRHCAPVLDLEPHAPAEAYLARRLELGAAEVNRRLLAGGGTVRYLVDTGFRAGELTTPSELAQLAGLGGSRGHEIVRLEAVAEAVAAAGMDAGGFEAAFAEALGAAVAATGAVGVKSVAAYRVGFRLDPARPTPAAVTAAAARWLGAGPAGAVTAAAARWLGAGPAGADTDGEAGGSWRLDDPVLTRALWWAAVDLGLPIQFHVGFGDADIRMHQVDPSLLTDWLHAHRVPVLLLHCWPYQRQASFLAAVHPHVHLDVGLALPYVGPSRAAAVLAEAAELTPFGKLLYSSDAFGVPELYHLAALTFRRGLGDLLTERVASGEWSAPDAVRVAAAIGHDNAMRVYGLGADGWPGAAPDRRTV